MRRRPDAPPERLTPHVEAFQAVVWHLLVSHPALAGAPANGTRQRAEASSPHDAGRAVFLDRDGVINEPVWTARPGATSRRTGPRTSRSPRARPRRCGAARRRASRWSCLQSARAAKGRPTLAARAVHDASSALLAARAWSSTACATAATTRRHRPRLGRRATAASRRPGCCCGPPTSSASTSRASSWMIGDSDVDVEAGRRGRLRDRARRAPALSAPASAAPSRPRRGDLARGRARSSRRRPPGSARRPDDSTSSTMHEDLRRRRRPGRHAAAGRASRTSRASPPTRRLMRKAGVADYAGVRAASARARSRTGRSRSRCSPTTSPRWSARRTRSPRWGDNVYVKIPVTNTRGESRPTLIRELSPSGVQVNVTALLTPAPGRGDRGGARRRARRASSPSSPAGRRHRPRPGAADGAGRSRCCARRRGRS